MFARRRRLMRGTAMVPKGFIRYHVLEALSEKPMSGSEIMEDVEKATGGFWKPSPGSIYPLLSWLQDNSYIKELPTENGLKRYELTESGKALLDEQKKIRQKFREAGFLPSPPFLDITHKKLEAKKILEVRKSMRQLSRVIFHLDDALRENFSERALNEALGIVDEASRKLEELNKKIRSGKYE
jgi:DNA-binding PadR family transcriptional regulator